MTTNIKSNMPALNDVFNEYNLTANTQLYDSRVDNKLNDSL